RSKIRTTILISPSITTDFEIHLSDLFGFTSKRNMDVVDEINKLSGEKVVTVFGEKETGFPVNKIRLNKHANITLPGDHHLDGDIGRLVRALLEYF
ncbi:MAG: AcvB/VirJ family lysyl-phosphatidylglycerol hydrolase, partial [Ginsengibacter sp.]